MLGFIKDLPLLPTSPLKFLIFFYIGFAVETDQSSVHLRRQSQKLGSCAHFFMCCGVIQLDSCSYSLNLSLISVATAKKKSWHIYQFVWPFSLVSFQRVLSLCESSNGMSQLILWKKPRCTAAHFVTGSQADWNGHTFSWGYRAVIFAFTGSFLHLHLLAV